MGRVSRSLIAKSREAALTTVLQESAVALRVSEITIRRRIKRADLLPEVMAERERRDAGPDCVVLARIEMDGASALRLLSQDRDIAAWTSTVERLDTEESDAWATSRTVPTAEAARVYLTNLPLLWQSSGLDERKQLANALFERLDVLDVEQVTVTMTQDAKDHGWLAAWEGQELVVPLATQSVGYGRGERRQATLRHLNVPANLPLEIEVTGTERWLRSSIS